MLGLVFLLAVPLVLGGFVVNNILNDEDDEQGDARETVDASDALVGDGEVYLENTGEEVLNGRDGVDIYLADEFSNNVDVPREINLGGGSDIAVIDQSFVFDTTLELIRGGTGDDRLSSPIGTLRGGPGDDILEGRVGMEVFGGADDDFIEVDARGGAFGAAVTTVAGGSGDDEITIIESPGAIADVNGRVEVTGGGGKDTFIIEARDFQGVNDDPNEARDPTDTSIINLLPYANINDFNPEEDKLVIQYASSSPEIEFAIEPLAAVPGREAGVSVTFTTSGNAFEPPQKGTVNLWGVTDLALDDVTFERIGGTITGPPLRT